MRSGHSIYIELPISEEYAHFLRLMVAGIAGRLSFGIDDIDDLKIAAEEAYVMAVNCCFGSKQRIDFNFSDDGLEITFFDLLLPRLSLDDNQRKEQDYGLFIIQAVVDEMKTGEGTGGADLKLIKKLKVVDKKKSQ